MIHLERLGPGHGPPLLAGQDQALAAEIVGRRWTPELLDAFLERAARWQADGPCREYAAVSTDAAAAPVLRGGGGITLLGPGLARGEAALTYWVLRAHRRRGTGRQIAAALVERARAEPRIDRLVLRIAPGNTASRAVARSLGARETAHRERHPADASRQVTRWVLDLRPAGR